MPGEMLTTDELDQLDDLSSPALYRAEVKRIPYLTRDETAACIEAARTGSIDARNKLICDCLHYTLYKADVTYRDRQPPHSDIMDVVGQAHVTLLEAFPRALLAEKPIKYLLSMAALEMRLYCTYDDPLIPRPRTRPFSRSHPQTVSMEAAGEPEAAEVEEHIPNEEYQLVYDAVQQLTEQRREIITAVYGLFGHSVTSIEEIAEQRQLKLATVKNYLWRAKTALARKLGPVVLEQRLHPHPRP